MSQLKNSDSANSPCAVLKSSLSLAAGKPASPQQIYAEALAEGRLLADKQQAKVVQFTESIYQRLIVYAPWSRLSWSRRMSNIWRRCYWFFYPSKRSFCKGLYLYGSVGLGKSMLLNMLYEALPLQLCRRYHFHDFMRWLHQRLHQVQGRADPIAFIFRQDLAGVRLLYIDEFLVEDSADAMILSRVLEALWKMRICLLTNANVAPSDLYAGGMYRERFLPAIACLQRYNKVVHMTQQLDYRNTTVEAAAERYVFPVTAEHKLHFANMLHACGLEQLSEQRIGVLGRKMLVRACTDSVIYVDFKVICGAPRCAKDYLSMIQQYKKWFIAEVPQLTASSEIYVVNFIKLIDILYDNKISCFLLAEVAIDNLYSAGRHLGSFKRTASRLQQMQSRVWPQQ